MCANTFKGYSRLLNTEAALILWPWSLTLNLQHSHGIMLINQLSFNLFESLMESHEHPHSLEQVEQGLLISPFHGPINPMLDPTMVINGNFLLTNLSCNPLLSSPPAPMNTLSLLQFPLLNELSILLALCLATLSFIFINISLLPGIHLLLFFCPFKKDPQPKMKKRIWVRPKKRLRREKKDICNYFKLDQLGKKILGLHRREGLWGSDFH